jgi:hypothetical protein
MTGRLWFLNALGFAALPFTSNSSLWVPLAFEQGMNVIRSLDILRPGALSSARWTNVFVGKSLQNRPLSSALYTCSGPRPSSSILSWNFLTKGSTAETSQDNFSPVMVRKRIPNRFLNSSSHPLPALKSSFIIIIIIIIYFTAIGFSPGGSSFYICVYTQNHEITLNYNNT